MHVQQSKMNGLLVGDVQSLFPRGGQQGAKPLWFDDFAQCLPAGSIIVGDEDVEILFSSCVHAVSPYRVAEPGLSMGLAESEHFIRQTVHEQTRCRQVHWTKASPQLLVQVKHR